MAFALPRVFTSRANSLLQVLVPFQDGVTRLADGLGSGDGAMDPVGEAILDEGLRSAVVSLAAQNQSLRQELATLTSVRDRGLGPRGRLVSTRVVAGDATSWRDSRQILGGSKKGLSAESGVVTDTFAIHLKEDDSIGAGLAVLSAERLVGVVEHVGTFVSRVKLLSDRETELTVTTARLEGERLLPVGANFLLVGRGHGRVQIREVHHQYVEDGTIALGDYVLTLADEPVLPPSITIGTISAITPDRHNALLYTLEVDPGVDYAKLRRLYVVDTDG